LLWDRFSESSYPQDLVIKLNPVLLETYAIKHDFFGTPGWKKLKACQQIHDQCSLAISSMLALISK
jgi:hypothetical protein